MLKYSTQIITLILTLFSCSCLSSRDSNKPFMFIQMADTQFGMKDKDKSFDFETKNFELAVDKANKMKPAFIVICGDLINKPGDFEQKREFKRIIKKLHKSIPLYLVSGNHDIGNVPTKESIEAYNREFGKDYYSFKYRNTRGIIINSTVSTDQIKSKIILSPNSNG